MNKRAKEKIRARLNERANEARKRDELRVRALRILGAFGFVWSSFIWNKFDVLLASEIREADLRKKVLKRVFSKNGGRILVADEKYIEIIETKIKENGKRSNV